ncbi:MAG: hypothetical protein KatS3mg095_0634 [Candidatus Parcubacteria bacterium]|nr:MAG: hypothetical protein KatS3mg095_0634 [Candidatus Parcubacteria bacterium]
MKEYLRLMLTKENVKIAYGVPDEQSEIDEMFDLRTEVYIKEKKYIQNIDKDIDSHDKNNSCIYFIAKPENYPIVGCARIIQEKILPIEKDYFDFQPPKEFQNIKNGRLVEIGRIISRPQRIFKKTIPRHIIILGIFYSMIKYTKTTNIIGGYGAIKKYAYEKFKKLGIPIYEIKKFKLKFNPQKTEDPLKNFFREDEPVIPVYFLKEDIEKYFDYLFNKTKIFIPTNNNTYTYKKTNLGIKEILKLKIYSFLIKFNRKNQVL